MRETATRSRPTPACPSSRDEEIEDLHAEVDGLLQDRLSLQHDIDRVRLEHNQLRERLELVEEQLNPRRSYCREEPRTGYHPYPRWEGPGDLEWGKQVETGGNRCVCVIAGGEGQWEHLSRYGM